MPVCWAMASSRKPRPTPDPVELLLLDAVRDAWQRPAAEAAPAQPAFASTLAPVRQSRRRSVRPQPLVIACSGGRDSTALLDVLARLRDERLSAARDLVAVHVHHGLHPHADAWAEFCREQCSARGVDFELRHVTVPRGRAGIEANARTARYAALAEIATARGASAVLTAHHLDDRIETFILQWLRGAGVDGLASFPSSRQLVAGVDLLRPFADIERSSIERYCELRSLRFIDDPSNADMKLARNAVRAQVMPALAAVRPNFRRTTARSIDLVAEAAELLGELAANALRHCTEGVPAPTLRLDRLQMLPPAQQTLVLRQWLASFGVEAPSRARLRELLAQALHARSDARLLVRIGAMEVRRHRGFLVLRRPSIGDGGRRDRVRLAWRGEIVLAVPAWGGRITFVRAPVGFDRQWLQAEPLEFRARTGGERFKPHPTRPSKTLKRLFQDAGIAEFERGALPLIWRDDRLIFVPRLGADARLVEPGDDQVMLAWEPDASLLSEPQADAR